MFRGAFAGRRAFLGFFLLLGSCCIGCVGFTSQLMYALKGGHKVDPAFEGLEEKRVAVVCVSGNSSFGPDIIAHRLESVIAAILRENVEDIDMIPQDEIADWIDHNDWDQIEYREIGRGVDAEMLLAVDIDNLSLREGSTLFKGRADVTVTVYDMEDGGKVVFRRSLPEYSFPRNGSRHNTEISEARFRSVFINALAQQVSKYFYPYRIEEDFANDAMMLGG